MPRLSRSQQLAHRRISDAAVSGLPVDRLARQLMSALQLAIPVDGYRLFGLDPATRLVNRVFAASEDDGWARLEYLQSVYLGFGPEVYAELSNVVNAGLRVAAYQDQQALCWGYPSDLLATTTPAAHFQLFHEMSSPVGGGIQAIFAANGEAVAALQIYRRESGSPFRASDVAFLEQVRSTIGSAIGAALARERAMNPVAGDGGENAGVLVLSDRGAIQFATPDGERWTDLLLSAEGAIDGPLPTAVWSVLARLRAGVDGAAAGVVTVQTPKGPVRLEATPGRNGDVAVVLTPVRAPVIPDLPESWALTRQEREVVKLVLRGASNREIAEALSIGEHTVESHLRNVYSRLELGSRGQLLARYFQETFYPEIERDASIRPQSRDR